MTKTVITASSNFGELVSDLLKFAEEFPETIHEAAEAQLQVIEAAIKTNWATMVPWANYGDYVYESIGYNLAFGKNKVDVVGMTGVFLIDHVAVKHGRNKPHIKKNGTSEEKMKAPQISYWVEFGYKPNRGNYQAGIPYMSNAYYATINKQDEVFADTLAALLDNRISK